jgi:uncharacterized protein YukE
MSIEILTFILPEADPIQITFGSIMLAIVLATIYFVKKAATPENWEKQWNGGTTEDSSDDLDTGHGSLTDLCHAVATSPEKLADIMPGILLIFGLLGTFLGLGVALNKASIILVEVNSSGVDGAMSNLMGMMQGLGTKFKTSTWGIIGFIALKGWISWDGFEERRLRWCVIKIKKELDVVRIKENKQIQLHNKILIDSIDRLGTSICSMLQKEISGNRDVLERNQTLLEAEVQNGLNLLDASNTTRQVIQSFVDSNTSNLATMKQASGDMAAAAGRVGDSADELQSAIESFRENVADVLGKLKLDLGETISGMSESFRNNMGEMSGQLSSATQGISNAVGMLSENVASTMGNVEISINKSVDIQTKANAEFVVTSDTLNTQVTAMTNLVEDLRERITSGLKAVSESGQRMVSLDKRYASITDAVEEMMIAIKKLISESEQRMVLLDKHFTSVTEAIQGMTKETDNVISSSQQLIDQKHEG